MGERIFEVGVTYDGCFETMKLVKRRQPWWLKIGLETGATQHQCEVAWKATQALEADSPKHADIQFMEVLGVVRILGALGVEI
ncbi:MAG: hypothetical protein ACYTBJ_02185 [Planctomycetota bacterium]|jgi:hypothetical protein